MTLNERKVESIRKEIAKYEKSLARYERRTAMTYKVLVNRFGSWHVFESGMTKEKAEEVMEYYIDNGWDACIAEED